MGRLSAEDMAQVANFEEGLRWHLFHNHYPPLPTGTLALAIEAIDIAKDAIALGAPELLNETIDISSIGQWRDQDYAPVWACVEAWHLEPWIGSSSE